MNYTATELIATCLFALAIIHTFSVPVFARLAHRGGPHAGAWHLLSEVEAVFGVWAFVLLAAMVLLSGTAATVAYMDSRNFTEPLFVFVIMVIAASRPVLVLVDSIVATLARALPGSPAVTSYFLTLGLVPLLGSLITEPAAMTLAAVMLRDASFRNVPHQRFKYATIGVLFVNISIGGVLTAYAAPPVLMVASTFGWDSGFMLANYGWRAACAVLVNASLLTWLYRGALRDAPLAPPATRRPVPHIVTAVHIAFLIGVVLTAHHPAIFLGLFLLFLGYTEAYKNHQDRLMIKEGLMVGFFLAGLIVLGGLQKWWLQDLLGSLPPMALYWGATALTAVTDNAALTYLGSLVEGSSDAWRYMLVAGAVTAGFAILRKRFPDSVIAPLPLLLGALPPTAVAAVFFLLPV